MWSFEVPPSGPPDRPGPSPSPSPSPGARANQQGLSPPVVLAERGLAVAVGPESVYGVALETGEEVWRVERAYGPSTSPAVARGDGGDVVLFTEGSTDASRVVAIEPGDGAPAWDQAVDLRAVSRTGVTVERDGAFVGDDRGNVYALDASSGDLRWSVQLEGRTLAPLTAGEGTIVAVVASGDRSLPVVLGLDAETGERRWRVAPAVAASGATTGVVDAGAFAVGLPDRSIHAVDVADGRPRWVSDPFYSLPSPFGAGAAYRGDFIFAFFGDLTGDLRRLDGRTGETVWDVPLNGPILRSPPVVAGASVVIGMRDGSLRAIDADTGDELFRGEPSPGLLGAIAVTPDLLVAVRGGLGGGLVAFEHDPSASVERVASPSVLDPAALVWRFAVALVIVLIVVLAPARLLAARRGAPSADEFAGPADDPDGEGAPADDAPAEPTGRRRR